MSDRIGDHRYAYFAYAAIITISAPRAPPPPPAFIRLPYLPPSLELSFSIGKKKLVVSDHRVFFLFFSFSLSHVSTRFLSSSDREGGELVFFFSRGNKFRFFIFAYLCARDIDSSSFFFIFL